jgi:hypothetical protein
VAFLWHLPFSHDNQEELIVVNFFDIVNDLMVDAILLAMQGGGRNTGATKLATVMHTAIALV